MNAHYRPFVRHTGALITHKTEKLHVNSTAMNLMDSLHFKIKGNLINCKYVQELIRLKYINANKKIVTNLEQIFAQFMDEFQVSCVHPFFSNRTD